MLATGRVHLVCNSFVNIDTSSDFEVLNPTPVLSPRGNTFGGSNVSIKVDPQFTKTSPLKSSATNPCSDVSGFPYTSSDDVMLVQVKGIIGDGH